MYLILKQKLEMAVIEPGAFHMQCERSTTELSHSDGGVVIRHSN
jgi:hypothetical protein